MTTFLNICVWPNGDWCRLDDVDNTQRPDNYRITQVPLDFSDEECARESKAYASRIQWS